MKFVTDGKTIRFGLVGAGRIAQSHLDALGGVEGAQLTAVVEPRKAAGEAAAEKSKARWFESHLDPALKDLVDAVIICAPPKEHAPIARYFLSSGVHAICEKPLTIKSAEAEELIGLAKKEGVVLMMASKFRYVDDIIKAKSIIEAGLLGKIVLYENTFTGKVAMRDRWNSQKEIAGGGVLIDNGTHSIDIARYLLGPIEKVQVELGVSAQGLEVEDTARLQFRTKTNVIGAIDLSWSINKEQEAYVSVYGSEGTLLVGWKGSRYRQDGSPAWVSFGAGYDKIGCLRRQIENFIGCMRGAQQPLITPVDALASVKVIEAAYQSATRDKWVEVGA